MVLIIYTARNRPSSGDRAGKVVVVVVVAAVVVVVMYTDDVRLLVCLGRFRYRRQC